MNGVSLIPLRSAGHIPVVAVVSLSDAKLSSTALPPRL